MVEYIISNKEWIFSGIGVVVLTFIISFLKRRKSSSNTVKIKGSSNKIHQVGSKTKNEIDIEGNMNDVKQP